MQYPSYPTPPSTSHSHRVSNPQAPNAPYLNPRDLPPTPTSVSSSAHAAPSSPYAPPPAMPTPGQINSYGLLTPPTSPIRHRGINLHPLLGDGVQSVMRFNIAYPLDRIRFSPPYQPNALSEIASQPPITCLTVSVIGVFKVQLSRPDGASLTVADVLHQLVLAMSIQPQWEELQRFAPEVQSGVSGQSAGHGQPPRIRRIDLLGPRVIFSGLEITQSSGTAALCDVRLSRSH